MTETTRVIPPARNIALLASRFLFPFEIAIDAFPRLLVFLPKEAGRADRESHSPRPSIGKIRSKLFQRHGPRGRAHLPAFLQSRRRTDSCIGDGALREDGIRRSAALRDSQ